MDEDLHTSQVSSIVSLAAPISNEICPDKHIRRKSLSTLSAPSSLNVNAQRVHDVCALSFSYTLSSSTYLRRLHIKIDDAKHLFIGTGAQQAFKVHGAARYLPDRAFLKQALFLVDDSDRVWTVQYECVLRGGQRHSRVNKGWSSFCSANGLKVGDKISLKRCCVSEVDNYFMSVKKLP